jgi:hypothetical protein
MSENVTTVDGTDSSTHHNNQARKDIEKVTDFAEETIVTANASQLQQAMSFLSAPTERKQEAAILLSKEDVECVVCVFIIYMTEFSTFRSFII